MLKLKMHLSRRGGKSPRVSFGGMGGCAQGAVATTLPRSLAAFALVLVLILSPIVLGVARAASADTTNAPHSDSAKVGHVTVIALDMSGSMSQNDPNGLRCSAADAYIALSGVGQQIGVVGLVDPSGSETGQIWAQPTDMATIQARNQLINTIKSKSNNCRPNGQTPTYDSLAKAYTMLQSATKGGRTGSVILLTDGVPAPDQGKQTNQIIQQLVPKFAQAGYPIDTIKLGNDNSVGSFLRNIASGTNGSYYDDVNPDTGQPDPLQIAPVFLQLFAGLTGRTPKPLVAQQPLSGGTTSRNFSVSAVDQHLDVVVIKQDPNASVTLVSPEGIRYHQSSSSVLVATDPHYAIFSIDGPTQGNWIVEITGGSGQFSAYGLVTTNLHIAFTKPSGSTRAFPIDQPLAIAGHLTSGNTDVNGDFTVTGKLTSGSHVIQQVILRHQTGSATYTGNVSLPSGQPSGTYDLTLYVTQGSDDILTVSAPRPINFELFPTPYLLSGTQAQVTQTTATATAFDPVLQRIYSLPVVTWFSGLPLQNIPAKPSAVVAGVVTLNNKVYTNAVVNGTVAAKGQKTSEVSIANTTPGHFEVIFPAATNGAYALTLNTTGSFQDSHGAFGTQQRQVTLSVVPATQGQEIRAWLFTLMYLIILIFLSPIFYRWFLASRQGMWTMRGRSRTQTESGSFRRLLGRRSYWRRWFRPNTVTSNELWGYPGLVFVWRRFGSDEVRPQGRGANDWAPSKRNTIAGKLSYHIDGNTTVAIDVTGAGQKAAGFTETARSGARSDSFGQSRSSSQTIRGGFGAGSSRGLASQRGAKSEPAGRVTQSARGLGSRQTTTTPAVTRARGSSAAGSRGSSSGFGRPR